MQEDMFKIIGVLIVSCFILFLIVKGFKLQTQVIEGLTNNDGTINPSISGEAGNALSYGSAIKAKLVQLQDELLIPKYRKEYENIIINYDDYVNILMLKQLLNMKLDSDIKQNIDIISNINTLKSSKDTLNDIMKWLDKQ